MLGFDGLNQTAPALITKLPGFPFLVINAPGHFAAHLDPAAHGFRLLGARFPHHAGTLARIFKRVDQCLDYFRFVFDLALREKRVFDRAT